MMLVNVHHLTNSTYSGLQTLRMAYISFLINSTKLQRTKQSSQMRILQILWKDCDKWGKEARLVWEQLTGGWTCRDLLCSVCTGVIFTQAEGERQWEMASIAWKQAPAVEMLWRYLYMNVIQSVISLKVADVLVGDASQYQTKGAGEGVPPPPPPLPPPRIHHQEVPVVLCLI